MSVFDMASLAASFPQLYRELVPQMQRKAPLLRCLPFKPSTTGQNIGWDVTFDGQAAGGVNLDGGALLSAAADPQVAATLGYAGYGAPIQVTTKAQWAGGAQDSASFLKNLIDRNLNEAVMKTVKAMNIDLYAGTGSSAGVGTTFASLSTAVTSSGSYATINSATSGQGNWVSTVQGNSGSLRSLTLALIKTLLSTVAKASPYGRPDWAVCPPAIFNALENLFDAFTHSYYNPLGGTVGVQMAGGRQDKMIMNPAVINTAGGQIQRTGFRALFWENAGVTFLEDPDCTNVGATNPNNVIYFMTSGAVEVQYLPPVDISNYMPDQKSVQAAEQDLGSLSSLKFDFRSRGRTKAADEFDILCAPQLVVKSRAACGLLQDVQ